MVFPSPHLSLWIALGIFLALATVTDLRRRVIPNRLVAASALVGVVLQLGAPSELVINAAVGIVLGGMVFALSVGYGKVRGTLGFGMGDVKAVAAVGLLVGWLAVPVLVSACALGSAFGIAGILTKRMTRTSRLPFAPLLLLGAIIVFAYHA